MPKKRAASPRSLAQAKRRYSSFTGQAPITTGKIRVAALPKAVVAIGYVDAIEYETMRHGRIERYRHRFAKLARPLFVCSPDGRRLMMLGGAFRFTNRGIVDTKGPKRRR